MRTLYLLIVIYIALIMTGCAANTSSPSTTTESAIPRAESSDDLAPIPRCHPRKDPVSVSLYTGQSEPNRPYKVLGTASVSKYNKGIKRQEAIIQDILRQQAVALDGDAVVGVIHNDKQAVGTVVSYERILA